MLSSGPGDGELAPEVDSDGGVFGSFIVGDKDAMFVVLFTKQESDEKMSPLSFIVIGHQVTRLLRPLPSSQHSIFNPRIKITGIAYQSTQELPEILDDHRYRNKLELNRRPKSCKCHVYESFSFRFLNLNLHSATSMLRY